MSRKATVIVLASVAAAFLLAGAYTTRPVSGQVRAANMPKMMTMVLEGNYRVHYDCVFIDKSTKKDKEEQVNKIEFHPEYIVLIGQTGSGRVIPVHAIKELTWEQS